MLAGCQKDSNEPTSANDTAAQSVKPAAQAGGNKIANAGPATTPARGSDDHPVSHPTAVPFFADDELNVEVMTPEVVLSNQHLETCRVKLGEQFPDLALSTFDGAPATLQSQLGERLTVVVFWSARQPMSIEQLRGLRKEVSKQYRDAGVGLVTIHVGNDDAAPQIISSTDAQGAVHLRDVDGQAFAQVATDLLPRIYLLRADRSVVWFDLEHTRSTSRELRNAMLFVLKQYEQQARTEVAPLM
jgi:hypothetical protein